MDGTIYIKFWNDVGKELCKMVEEFMRNNPEQKLFRRITK